MRVEDGKRLGRKAGGRLVSLGGFPAVYYLSYLPIGLFVYERVR